MTPPPQRGHPALKCTDGRTLRYKCRCTSWCTCGQSQGSTDRSHLRSSLDKYSRQQGSPPGCSSVVLLQRHPQDVQFWYWYRFGQLEWLEPIWRRELAALSHGWRLVLPSLPWWARGEQVPWFKHRILGQLLRLGIHFYANTWQSLLDVTVNCVL